MTTGVALRASDPARTFRNLVERGEHIGNVAAFLDQLDPEARVQAVLRFPGYLQSRLFALARGFRAVTIEDLTPTPGAPAIMELRNSLPVFNVAQKRFYRPEAAVAEAVGYNHTPPFLRFFVGPGYFRARSSSDGEVVIDYTVLPEVKAEGWPQIIENRGRLRGATYGEQIDYLRRVSNEVFIGTAYQKGKHRGAWFILTRAAPPPGTS
jgi:hypothetical protein